MRLHDASAESAGQHADQQLSYMTDAQSNGYSDHVNRLSPSLSPSFPDAADPLTEPVNHALFWTEIPELQLLSANVTLLRLLSVLSRGCAIAPTPLHVSLSHFLPTFPFGFFHRKKHAVNQPSSREDMLLVLLAPLPCLAVSLHVPCF